MKPPFDIAGDLDTPVSAFAKLAAFNPRFLLESVEGGERVVQAAGRHEEPFERRNGRAGCCGAGQVGRRPS